MTPFDLHTTLKHLITYPEPLNRSINSSNVNGVIPWTYSLLEPIPESRSCKDARIPVMFCGCVDWEQVEIAENEESVQKAIGVAMIGVNNRSEIYRDLCAKQEFKSVHSYWRKSIDKSNQL
jgi:hypothetical protein